MKTFNTRNGKTVSGDALLNACKRVAQELRESAEEVKKENAFASHVTDVEKEAYIKRYWLDIADTVERGNITSFTIWQKINYVLTGECVALLGK